MTLSIPTKLIQRLSSAFMLFLLSWGLLIVFGKVPNPVDRYFEVPPGSYRLLADIFPSASNEYRTAVANVMERDGKISLATYPELFRLWTKNVRTVYPMPNGEMSLDEERGKLRQVIEKYRAESDNQPKN